MKNIEGCNGKPVRKLKEHIGNLQETNRTPIEDQRPPIRKL